MCNSATNLVRQRHTIRKKMGCDYYLYTYLEVLTDDAREMSLEYNREERWVGDLGDGHDHTFDELLEAAMERAEETKTVYDKEKGWGIRNPERMERYLSCLRQNGLTLDQVDRIVRRKESVLPF